MGSFIPVTDPLQRSNKRDQTPRCRRRHINQPHRGHPPRRRRPGQQARRIAAAHDDQDHIGEM